MALAPSSFVGRTIGRYFVHEEIAAGGMASVHLGRLVGPVGFARTVAIKCLHPHLARDPEFVAMFLDEARLAAQVRHPNVAATLDVVAEEGQLLLVMDFVQGESVARLLRKLATRGESFPVPMAVTIAREALLGLHAAHEAKGELGAPLAIVHRDVSPQNILVGADGVTRVVDFGVAKAVGRLQTTREGQIKGKTSYMAPEQLRGLPVDRRTDIYAASVVLWEMLTGERLFSGDTPAGVMTQVLEKPIEPPSRRRPELPKALDHLVLRGLARDADARCTNAREMALALAETVPPVTATTIGDWLEDIVGDVLGQLSERVALLESASSRALRAESRDATHAAMDGGALDDIPLALRISSSAKADAASEVSTISVSSGARRLPRQPRPLVWLLAGGLAASAAFVVWSRVRSSSGETATPGAVTASTETSTAPTASSAASELPEARAADIAAPSATPSATADPAPARRPDPRTTRGAARPKGGCVPPYTVDSHGVHIPKPGCY